MAEKKKMGIDKRNVERTAVAKAKTDRIAKMPKEITTAKKKEISLTGPTGQKKTTARKLTMKKKK